LTIDEDEVFAMNGSAGQEAPERLDVLVGEWEVEADLPGPPAPAVRNVFEWTLGRRFLEKPMACSTTWEHDFTLTYRRRR
jgi:hypothetical protein